MPRFLTAAARSWSGLATSVRAPICSRSSASSTVRRWPDRALAGSSAEMLSSNAIRPNESRCRCIRYASAPVRYDAYCSLVIGPDP